MSYLTTNHNLIDYSTIVSTDLSDQTISTSTVTVNGTSISFTPLISTNKVIYECYFSYSWSPDNTNSVKLELFEDTGDGYSSLGDGYVVYESAAAFRHNGICNIKHFLPGYSGTRSYEIRATATSTSTEIKVLGASGFYPIVTMYSYLNET